jgi:hypothetical protein
MQTLKVILQQRIKENNIKKKKKDLKKYRSFTAIKKLYID